MSRYDQLTDQQRATIDEAAKNWLSQFDDELSQGQNLIMACIGMTTQVSATLTAINPMLQMARLVSARDDDAMSGLYVGLMLSAHDPALAGVLLETMSLSHKKHMAEVVEAGMSRLWELANES